MKIIFEEKVANFKFNSFFSTEIVSGKSWWDESFEASSLELDFERTEWISAEAMTFIFAWLNDIRIKNPTCHITIRLPSTNPLNDELPENEITKERIRKRKKRAINLLDTWQIQKKCNLFENSILGSTSINKEIIDHDNNIFRITPFYSFNLESYTNPKIIRTSVEDKMQEIYDLEDKLLYTLTKFSSHTPFENKTISHLVTVELFLNAVHHSQTTHCFLSVALINKFTKNDLKESLLRKKAYLFSKEKKISFDDALLDVEVSATEIENKFKYCTESILNKNIKSERNKIVWNFFKKEKNAINFENRSYIELNFIDFGVGIPTTLKKNYLDNNQKTEIKSQLNDDHFNTPELSNRFNWFKTSTR